MNRVRKLFQRYDITFKSKESYLNINGCELEAFPSFHVDSFRSLENPAVIYISESDFFPRHQQVEVRHVAERYIGKGSGDCYIIIESTPNAPGGLMQLRLDYTFGLDKIFSQRHIQNAKRSPSFAREYNLAFTGQIGNTFRQSDIARAIEAEYDIFGLSTYGDTQRVLSIDPAYSSSAFGFCVTELRNGKIAVLFADEYASQTSEKMLDFTQLLYNKYEVIDKILVDNHNVGFIKSLKQRFMPVFHEEIDYFHQIEYYKKQLKIDWCNNRQG